MPAQDTQFAPGLMNGEEKLAIPREFWNSMWIYVSGSWCVGQNMKPGIRSWLSYLKVLHVRLPQVQSKAGGTGNNPWDS